MPPICNAVCAFIVEAMILPADKDKLHPLAICVLLLTNNVPFPVVAWMLLVCNVPFSVVAPLSVNVVALMVDAVIVPVKFGLACGAYAVEPVAGA